MTSGKTLRKKVVSMTARERMHTLICRPYGTGRRGAIRATQDWKSWAILNCPYGTQDAE